MGNTAFRTFPNSEQNMWKQVQVKHLVFDLILFSYNIAGMMFIHLVNLIHVIISFPLCVLCSKTIMEAELTARRVVYKNLLPSPVHISNQTFSSYSFYLFQWANLFPLSDRKHIHIPIHDPSTCNNDSG